MTELGYPSLRIAPARSRMRRRSFPIHAYIGPNGGGKSMAAIFDTLPSLAAGRPVVSTVKILDPATGEPHPLYIPLDDFRTVLKVGACDVIMDEVAGVASSRESMGMPAAIGNHLQQQRRSDIALRWTAPAWKRADTIIRECSQAVTVCMGFLGQSISSVQSFDGPHGPSMIADDVLTDEQRDAMWCPQEGPHEHDLNRLWSSKRLFYWRTYDAAAFDEWTAHKKESVRPVARALFWRPGSVAERAYDTFDSVLSLGVVSEHGLCMDCGGNRAKPKCQCGEGSAPRASRSRRPRRVTIEETDYTPSVMVELPDMPVLESAGPPPF